MRALTILIVDDEKISRDAFLSGVNWKALGIGRVLEAASAQSARELFRSEKIDLMLTDIEMPQESGLELLAWVRREAKLKIPCAILTCHNSFPFAQEALRLECFDYLLKPVEFQEVEKLIRKMIDSYLDETKQQIAAEYGRQYLLETQLQEKQDSGAPQDLDEIIDAQIVYIRSHLQSRLLLPELADQAGYNLHYYNRVFKEKTGVPVKRFIAQERMKLAGQLLREGSLKAYAISKLVGYDNYSHFVNMFKKTYGVTPDQYRNSNGE